MQCCEYNVPTNNKKKLFQSRNYSFCKKHVCYDRVLVKLVSREMSLMSQVYFVLCKALKIPYWLTCHGYNRSI